MVIKGIDVSEWQGNLTKNNWLKVKNSGIQFAILRCGYTTYGKSKKKYVDRYFENNYKICKEIGLPIGVYYYSCATNETEAKEEANFVLSLIKNKKFEYPVVIDTEDNHNINKSTNSPVSQASIGKYKLTPLIKTFCEIIESKGYYVSIYASTYWFKNNLILEDLKLYDKWIAQWSKTVSVSYKYGMWQYSSQGTVNGLSDNIDLDYAYLDYPEIMKKNGLNGFEKETISEPITEPDKEENNKPDTDEPNNDNNENKSDDNENNKNDEKADNNDEKDGCTDDSEAIIECTIIVKFIKMVIKYITKIFGIFKLFKK